MTDLPDGAVGATAQDAETMKKLYELFQQFSESIRTEGGASSSDPFNVPEKDKKTPKKIKKEDKRVVALKKKKAYEKARHTKSKNELRCLELSVAIEKQEKIIDKRKSLLLNDEKRLQALKDKRDELSAQ